MPVPAQLLKLVLGEMAKELLLVSARVIPEKLTQSGFKFQHPKLETALGHILER
jgi:NAD dependent epimerase/dehydratase family enzyme